MVICAPRAQHGRLPNTYYKCVLLYLSMREFISLYKSTGWLSEHIVNLNFLDEFFSIFKTFLISEKLWWNFRYSPRRFHSILFMTNFHSSFYWSPCILYLFFIIKLNFFLANFCSPCKPCLWTELSLLNPSIWSPCRLYDCPVYE